MLPARVVPQEMEEVCGLCLQRVAAVQLELGTSSAFTQTLVAHGGRMCEGLAPDLAQQVRGLGSLLLDVTAAQEHLSQPPASQDLPGGWGGGQGGGVAALRR